MQTPLPVVLSFSSLVVALAGCSATSHPQTPAPLGVSARASQLEAVVDEPGPLTVETVIAADWQVALSGLVNLDHPEAKKAQLVDREEPIHIAFHVVRHPTRGMFLVDTGVEHQLFDNPDEAVIRGLAARLAKADKIKRRIDTKTWLDQHGQPTIAGVFLTHLHVDHIAGMRDVPDGTPVFVGSGEASARSFGNLFVAPIVDRALENKPLSALSFSPDLDGAFDGLIDVFGDGSFWAIYVPGHTAGSTAYLARTDKGSVLFTGDACHTAWGWDHGVEPGSFSSDLKASALSLENLRRFAAKHPTMDVRLGHQAR